jgi:hypothetical protein
MNAMIIKNTVLSSGCEEKENRSRRGKEERIGKENSKEVQRRT